MTNIETKPHTFPIADVRASFPALQNTDNGRRRIYLDNPAGTLVAQQVIDAVSRVYLEFESNTGVFNVYSMEIDEMVDRVYAAMACFLGTMDSGEIIIGPNTTNLSFQLARNMAHMFGPGDEIILTHMEHEGHIAPWLQLAEETGVTIRWLPFNKDSWRIEPQELAMILNENTKLLALNQVSNVTGIINDVKELTRLAKSAGALVYIDGVQFAPHYLVDVTTIGCDFFRCSPYKFFGPHLGVVWGKRSILEQCRTYNTRIASKDLPHRFAIGTPQYELLSGLLGMISYFEMLGRQGGVSGDRRSLIANAWRLIEAHEGRLVDVLRRGVSDIPEIKLVGPGLETKGIMRAPMFAFLHRQNRLDEVAKMLNSNGIYCHWGRNFANPVANHLDMGPAEGFIRMGVSHYNTQAEVETALDCLRRGLD